MGKSVQIIIISTLLIILLAIQSIFTFAITIKKSPYNETSGITIETKYPDGTLDFLKYTTSATGATSGIRYKFTAITVEISDGVDLVIPTKNVTGGANPAAGKQEFYDIIIPADALIKEYKKQIGRELTDDEDKKFKKAFAEPDKIDLGAYIEIYNADTGKILETIRNFNEIESKASKYGFPKRNLNDMKSRFKGTTQQRGTEEEPPPKTGLRPSVIVN